MERFKADIFFESIVRKNINDMINILYVECQDNESRVNEQLFNDVADLLKEKTSKHINNVLDAYKKL